MGEPRPHTTNNPLRSNHPPVVPAEAGTSPSAAMSSRRSPTPPSSFPQQREPRAGARQGAVSPSRRSPTPPPSYRRKPVSRGAGHLHQRHGRCTRAPNPTANTLTKSVRPEPVEGPPPTPHQHSSFSHTPIVLPAKAGIQRGRESTQPPTHDSPTHQTPPLLLPKPECRSGQIRRATSSATLGHVFGLGLVLFG